MNVRLETLGTSTLVVAAGRLDFAAAADFQAQLEALLAGAAAAPGAVIVDCAALDYVSSAGLRVFLLGARAAQRAGRSFAVCALTPAVADVFALSGFGKVIAVHADRAAALAHAAPRPA